MKRARVFISYRRNDTGGHAARLAADLQRRLGRPWHVVFDTKDIKPAEPFRTRILGEIKRSSAVVVVIGPDWTTAEDEQGRIRIQQDEDLLHDEVHEALRSSAVVLPVLVGSAQMPTESELPTDLQPITRLNALEMTTTHWRSDLERLTRAVRRSAGGLLTAYIWLRRMLLPIVVLASLLWLIHFTGMFDPHVGNVLGFDLLKTERLGSGQVAISGVVFKPGGPVGFVSRTSAGIGIQGVKVTFDCTAGAVAEATTLIDGSFETMWKCNDCGNKGTYCRAIGTKRGYWKAGSSVPIPDASAKELAE